MKTASFSITALVVATLSISATAQAADVVTIDTQVRQGVNVVATPQVAVESGKAAAIRVGELELNIVPDAQETGAVVIAASFMLGADTANPVCVAQPKIFIAAGKTATVKVGEWEVSFTPAVAK